MGKRRARRVRDDGDDSGYNLADMMSGRSPRPSGVDWERATSIVAELGGPDAIDWGELERTEAAIVAREDQRTATALDALRGLHAPRGISEAGMAEYLISKVALPSQEDMERALIIRIMRELCGRLPRRRKD